MLLAPSPSAAAPSASLPAHPVLRVPDDIRSQLVAARAAGTSDAARWVASTPGGGVEQLARFAQATVPAPHADVRLELARLHRMQAHASDATMRASAWMSKEGQPSGKLNPESWWTQALTAYGAEAVAQRGPEAGARDAARAAALLQGVLKINDDATFSAKYALPERRPYTYAKGATPPAGGWTGQDLMSHPSGHTSRAYAAAAVLGALWPAKAAELMQVAEGCAHSRLLEDMHFPHDIAMGARIGTLVAQAMLAGERDLPVLTGR